MPRFPTFAAKLSGGTGRRVSAAPRRRRFSAARSMMGYGADRRTNGVNAIDLNDLIDFFARERI
jgi:hypothetical protein